MNILDILLKKKTGTDNIKELRAEEQELIEQWEEELAGKPVTIEGLKKFLKKQVTATDAAWSEWDNSPNKDLFLKVYIRFCRLILAYIERPEKIKEYREGEIEKEIEKEEKPK